MKIKIPRPFDAHVHLRDGAMLATVAGHTAAYCYAAVVMPNVPAIHDTTEALAYRERIRRVAPDCNWLMTLKATHRTTPAMIREAADAGVVSLKVYPTGATTGSHDGITDVKALAPVLAEMQRVGMVLCIHAEEPSAFVMDREEKYLDNVAWIVRHFPGLKVVLEHVTTEAAVEFVEAASVNVVATVTAHHLMTTLDDVIGSGLKPHNFCYPVPKRPEDQFALRRAIYYGNEGKFIFGSDTAPHYRGAKESACGCAGVYAAPVALSVLAEWFVAATAVNYYSASRETVAEAEARMARFTSVDGCRFYGLEVSTRTVTLVDEPWEVPAEIDGVVPFRAGEILKWKVVP